MTVEVYGDSERGEKREKVEKVEKVKEEGDGVSKSLFQSGQVSLLPTHTHTHDDCNHNISFKPHISCALTLIRVVSLFRVGVRFIQKVTNRCRLRTRRISRKCAALSSMEGEKGQNNILFFFLFGERFSAENEFF